MVSRDLPSWLCAGSRHLVLLAPGAACIPEQLGTATCDPGLYNHLLTAMQRLRGGVYL